MSGDFLKWRRFYNARMATALLAALIVVSLLQSPSMAPQPSGVVSQARAALAAIRANDFASVEAQFTDQMKAALPPGRLAAMWNTVLAQAGAVKGCGADPRVVSIADKQMVITPCELERATIDVQFAFDRTGRISGLSLRPAARAAVAYTPPAYANPSSFSERELTVGSGDWMLPATLTVPSGSGVSPAVVLVHGSGPSDRDETIGANKPFKDLAAGLATRGIAVLRYDKRTMVHAAKAGATNNGTVREEVIDDAVEAVRMLRTQPGIDPKRVFVVGHSLGGTLIPRIAAVESSVAGFVVLAGAARALEDAIIAQTRYLAGADGTISPEEQRAIEQALAHAETVRSLKPEDAASGRRIGAAPASYWLDLRGYDPAAAAKEIRRPMLILQGERDFQVTLEDFARWKAALGSRPDVTFRSYPALNHLFIAGTGPSLPAEYHQPGHVAEEVVRDIAAWIGEQR